MKVASVAVAAATLIVLQAPGLAAAAPPKHPDLTLPSAVKITEDPTELEPIEVTGRANPLDLAIDRAKLLIDLSCKICKDADFSVKGTPRDRFADLMLAPGNEQTRNVSTVLASRCADNPGVYLSCFSPMVLPAENLKEGEVTHGMWTDFVRLLKGQ